MGEPQAVHGVRRRCAGAVAGPAGEGDRWLAGIGGHVPDGQRPQCRPPAGSRVRPLPPASREVIGSRVLVIRPVSDSSWSVTSITVRPSGWIRNPTCQPPTGSRTRIGEPTDAMACSGGLAGGGVLVVVMPISLGVRGRAAGGRCGGHHARSAGRARGGPGRGVPRCAAAGAISTIRAGTRTPGRPAAVTK